jgi:hypothetical protein
MIAEQPQNKTRALGHHGGKKCYWYHGYKRLLLSPPNATPLLFIPATPCITNQYTQCNARITFC